MIEQQLKRHGEAFSPKLKDGAITMARLVDDVKAIIEQTNNNISTHLNNTNNPHKVTATTVGLGNVTNESKETMFANPTFTGIPKAPTASSETNNTQIATTAFVQDLISKLAKQVKEIGQSSIGQIYAQYLMSNQNFDTISDFDDDKYLITYDERAAGTIDLGIHEVAAGAKLPKVTSSKVYFGCCTDRLDAIIDDEVTSTQFLLYPNDTVYVRRAITWYYLDGVTKSPKYGDWEESLSLYYFENHLS